MSEPESLPLPLLVVSAADEAAAAALVHELLGAEVVTGVWHVATKYYTARVALRLRAHHTPLTARADAHLVHLGPQECSSPEVLSSRVQAVRVVPHGVLVCACAAPPGARLQAAARALHCPLVALQPAADDDDDWGAPVLRDALHAHLWPNLRTHHHIHEAENMLDSSSECVSDEDGDGEGDGEDMERALQRCEQFADMLGAVQDARGAVAGDDQWAEERAQRLQRAEELVLAFTRTFT